MWAGTGNTDSTNGGLISILILRSIGISGMFVNGGFTARGYTHMHFCPNYNKQAFYGLHVSLLMLCLHYKYRYNNYAVHMNGVLHAIN